MNIVWLVLDALLGAYGYDLGKAFAFDFVTKESKDDSPLVAIRFRYRDDPKAQGSRIVEITFDPEHDRVRPPQARGQRPGSVKAP